MFTADPDITCSNKLLHHQYSQLIFIGKPKTLLFTSKCNHKILSAVWNLFACQVKFFIKYKLHELLQ